MSNSIMVYGYCRFDACFRGPLPNEISQWLQNNKCRHNSNIINFIIKTFGVLYYVSIAAAEIKNCCHYHLHYLAVAQPELEVVRPVLEVGQPELEVGRLGYEVG